MKKLPMGCDYQGRHPEASRSDPNKDIDVKDIVLALLLATSMLGVTALLAWALARSNT